MSVLTPNSRWSNGPIIGTNLHHHDGGGELRFPAKWRRWWLNLVGIDSSINSESNGRGRDTHCIPEEEKQRWRRGDSDHHVRRCSGHNCVMKMGGFSSSRCTESIETEITSIGGRTKEILRSKVSVVFETSAGDYGLFRRRTGSCDLSKCSAHRKLSIDTSCVKNGGLNLKVRFWPWTVSLLRENVREKREINAWEERESETFKLILKNSLSKHI